MERGDREDVQSSHCQFGGPRSEAQQAFGVGGLATLQAGQVTATAEQIHVKPLQVLLPQEDLKGKNEISKRIKKMCEKIWSQLFIGCGSAEAAGGEKLLSNNPRLQCRPLEAQHTDSLTNHWNEKSSSAHGSLFKKNFWAKSIDTETNAASLKSSHRRRAQATQIPNIHLFGGSLHTHKHTPIESSHRLLILPKKECFLRRWERICTIELVFVFFQVVFFLYWQRIK